jgi:hypothetical protein
VSPGWNFAGYDASAGAARATDEMLQAGLQHAELCDALRGFAAEITSRKRHDAFGDLHAVFGSFERRGCRNENSDCSAVAIGLDIESAVELGDALANSRKPYAGFAGALQKLCLNLRRNAAPGVADFEEYRTVLRLNAYFGAAAVRVPVHVGEALLDNAEER